MNIDMAYDETAYWDSEGRLHQAQWQPSPNFDARPENTTIDLIVIHAISLPPGEFGGSGITDLFTNQLDPAAHPYYANIHQLRVSAHFLILRQGELLQFVACDHRAWHAGVSSWQGRERCNDFSIGIELEGCDELPFMDIQYQRLNWLLSALAQRYPNCSLAGHADISPGRKTDPGPCFSWEQLGRSSER